VKCTNTRSTESYESVTAIAYTRARARTHTHSLYLLTATVATGMVSHVITIIYFSNLYFHVETLWDN